MQCQHRVLTCVPGSVTPSTPSPCIRPWQSPVVRCVFSPRTYSNPPTSPVAPRLIKLKYTLPGFHTCCGGEKLCGVCGHAPQSNNCHGTKTFEWYGLQYEAETGSWGAVVCSRMLGLLTLAMYSVMRQRGGSSRHTPIRLTRLG